MGRWKEWRGVYKQLVMVSQFGLSLVMPLLLCLLLCAWLTWRFEIGLWIYLPGFVFGLGASFTTAYKFYLSIEKSEDDSQEKKRVSFNRHK